MFSKDSAFKQAEDQNERARLERKANPAHFISLDRDGQMKLSKAAPFEHWHHDLVTVDTLLDQQPPEVERARALLLEVADEIHSQFEGMHSSKGIE